MNEVKSIELNESESIDLANLSRLQAARLCGVSPTTFDRWWRKRGLPFYVLPDLDNRKRFNIVEIRKWQRNYRKSYKPKRTGGEIEFID